MKKRPASVRSSSSGRSHGGTTKKRPARFPDKTIKSELISELVQPHVVKVVRKNAALSVKTAEGARVMAGDAMCMAGDAMTIAAHADANMQERCKTIIELVQKLQQNQRDANMHQERLGDSAVAMANAAMIKGDTAVEMVRSQTQQPDQADHPARPHRLSHTFSQNQSARPAARPCPTQQPDPARPAVRSSQPGQQPDPADQAARPARPAVRPSQLDQQPDAAS